jgi:hypothetical protein
MAEQVEIERLLKLGSLSDSEISRRAAFLAEDIKLIGFETFRLSARPYPLQNRLTGEFVSVPIPEYHFGETPCSIQNAENADENKIEWFGGTGLDRGHLQFFSKVAEIGRAVIPSFWLSSAKLRTALRNPPQHLDTVEEVWWLARWEDIENIRMGVPLVEKSDRDVDWVFDVAPERLRVNLEVKRVKSDAVRHVRDRPFNQPWFSRFCANKVLPKFRESGPDEVNVLALSLFGEIDRDVQSTVADWLVKEQHLVDAIIIASREARHRSGFDQQLANEKAKRLKPYLKAPDIEDASLVFALDVPVRIPSFS